MIKSKPLTKKEPSSWYVARKVLRRNGVTYEDIAQRLGVSVSSASAMINYPPNVLRIVQMSVATGIPFARFFDFTAMPQEQAAVLMGVQTTGFASRPYDNGPQPTAECPYCGHQVAIHLGESDED